MVNSCAIVEFALQGIEYWFLAVWPHIMDTLLALGIIMKETLYLIKRTT
jgi:hypothetical protein